MAFPWQEDELKDANGVLKDANVGPKGANGDLKDANGELENANGSLTLPRKPVIYWANVFKFSIFHLMAVYAVFFEIQNCKWITLVWAYALYLFGELSWPGSHETLNSL